MQKKSIIILGGIRPHAILANYLRSRGYRTVLIDYLPNPIAKSCVDVHYQESSLDIDAVERISRKENAKFIMDLCTDRAIPPAAYVAEKLGLIHPYSYETSLIATNKNKMKAMLMDAGIPTSNYIHVTTDSQANNLCLHYPLIIKPSDASGSIGISKVEYEGQLANAVSKALAYSRNQEAVIEEFVHGTEIQIDCFISNGVPNVLDIKEKRMHTTERLTLSYGSLIPARISENIIERCHTITRMIANSLKIKNGPLYIQAIVSNGEIYVIEFGLRFGGNLSFKILQDVSGIDIIKTTANAYLGESVEIIPSPMPCKYYATYHVFPKQGVFSSIVGFEELIKEKVIEAFYIQKNAGLECEGNLTSKERLASFIICADTLDENKEKLLKTLKTIDVLDFNNKSIMRKDIYDL